MRQSLINEFDIRQDSNTPRPVFLAAERKESVGCVVPAVNRPHVEDEGRGGVRTQRGDSRMQNSQLLLHMQGFRMLCSVDFLTQVAVATRALALSRVSDPGEACREAQRARRIGQHENVQDDSVTLPYSLYTLSPNLCSPNPQREPRGGEDGPRGAQGQPPSHHRRLARQQGLLSLRQQKWLVRLRAPEAGTGGVWRGWTRGHVEWEGREERGVAGISNFQLAEKQR